jgi:hypothetical protein
MDSGESGGIVPILMLEHGESGDVILILMLEHGVTPTLYFDPPLPQTVILNS